MRSRIADVMQYTAVRGLRDLGFVRTISGNQRSANIRLREDANVALIFGGDRDSFAAAARLDP